MLGLCCFFVIIFFSMSFYQKDGNNGTFNPMSIFGYADKEEERQGVHVQHHTTHLKAKLDVLSNAPFQNRVFHRDLNVVLDNGRVEGEEEEEDFVYGRPVPGMHTRPLPHREMFNHVEVLWQIPPPPMRIKYLALLFHGCGRRSMSFYSSPEGSTMIELLLSNNYAVAAFSKMDDEHGCWILEPKKNQDDEVEKVGKAIKLWIERLNDIPNWNVRIGHVKPFVHGFGTSSGGHLVTKLATDVKYSHLVKIGGMHVQVAAPVVIPKERWSHVPTIFTIMSRDWNVKSEVKRLVATLNGMNVPTKVMESKSKKITPDYFRKRIDGVSKSLSGAMYR